MSTFYDTVDLEALADLQDQRPDQPGAEPHLRRCFRDAGLTVVGAGHGAL